MPLEAIVYCSRVATGTTVDQIDWLVRDAASHNLIAGVTGVLFCDGFSYLQYIEGPEDGIAVIYARILNASSHTAVEELGRGYGGPRRFPYWSMRWLALEQIDLRIAKASNWRGLEQSGEEAMFQVPTGIDRIATLVRPHLN
ncbi:TPA: BLUF domain-containing protein [Stenotrophomonas maltophilia]|nr:BLUF domain-containing protein [Stenotrophomonas maltophilia]